MESGFYRNPSRTSPVNVGLQEYHSERFNFYCPGNPPKHLVAVSCGMLTESRVTKVSDKSLRQKFVRVVLHNQEAQRYMGFVRMVSGHASLHAQYNQNALEFATRPLRQDSPSNSEYPCCPSLSPALTTFNSTG